MFPLITIDKSSKVIKTQTPFLLPFEVDVVSLDPSISTHASIHDTQYKVLANYLFLLLMLIQMKMLAFWGLLVAFQL